MVFEVENSLCKKNDFDNGSGYEFNNDIGNKFIWIIINVKKKDKKFLQFKEKRCIFVINLKN